jgi:hypothetical protein
MDRLELSEMSGRVKSILDTFAGAVKLARSAATDSVPGGKTVMMDRHQATTANVVSRGKLRRTLQSSRADGVVASNDNESM